MPEAQETLKESTTPMVELDTSGPGASVDLPETQKEEEKTYEKEEKKNEANVTYDDQPADTSEKPVEQSDVREGKSEGGEVVQKTSEEGSDKQPDNQKQVEEYSEGVKKRIAKLTKKMREAERQREEALAFARRIQDENKSLNSRVNVLDTDYVAEMEGRVKSSLLAAQQKLIAARDANDKKAEVGIK